MYQSAILQHSAETSSVTIPRSMLERHLLREGDQVLLVDTDDGILVIPFDPSLVRAAEIAGRGIAKYRNALRELAD